MLSAKKKLIKKLELKAIRRRHRSRQGMMLRKNNKKKKMPPTRKPQLQLPPQLIQTHGPKINKLKWRKE